MAGGGGGYGSIAALSRLGSLGGNPSQNQFFDPGGEYADAQDAWGQRDDALEQSTGLNTTARSALALRQMQDMFDELDARQAQRRNAAHLMDASWFGADGIARTSPDLAAGDRALYLGDERVAHDAANLPTMLRMEHDKLLNQEQAKAEGYWIPQNVSAREDQRRNVEDVLGQKNDLALQQTQAKSAAAQLLELLKGRSATSVATIRAGGQEDDAAMRAFAAAVRRGDVDPMDPVAMDKLRTNMGVRPNGAPVTPMGQAGGPAEGTTRTVNGYTYVYSSTGPKGPGFYLR